MARANVDQSDARLALVTALPLGSIVDKHFALTE
jgi:hypothetical protein